MDRQPIFVSMSTEVLDLLAENDLDLISELNKQGYDLQRGQQTPDTPLLESNTKSAALIILVSAAAAPTIATAIVRIIEAIGRGRKASATSEIWIQETDSQGKSLFNQDGTPKMIKQVVQTLPTNSNNPSSTTKFKFLGLTFEMTDTY